MGTATTHLDIWSLAWREFWRKISPPTADRRCRHLQSLRNRLGFGTPRVLFAGTHYCLDECLEQALTDSLGQAAFIRGSVTSAHRIPIGLLLLSRQQLTVEQLQHALTMQRQAGRGRLGEWLQELGFVGEEQITAALARQWSCPILRSTSSLPGVHRAPQLPHALLEAFAMVPVDYIEATATLHLAFAGGPEYRVLYAMEQMLECRTEPCLAMPSFVHKQLQCLAGPRHESEVVFERVSDNAEISRIIRSYAARLGISEIRVSPCALYQWVRLLRPSRPAFDLLFRSASAPTVFGTFVN